MQEVDKLFVRHNVFNIQKYLLIIWILRKAVTHDQVISGGNGKGNRLDQLNEPSAIFVDHNRAVFLADYSSDRLVKWTKYAKEGILLGKLRNPKTIHVSQSENIYAIDGHYSRVVHWSC